VKVSPISEIYICDYWGTIYEPSCIIILKNCTSIIELFLHHMVPIPQLPFSTKHSGALPRSTAASNAHNLINNDPETNHRVVGIPLWSIHLHRKVGEGTRKQRQDVCAIKLATAITARSKKLEPLACSAWGRGDKSIAAAGCFVRLATCL